MTDLKSMLATWAEKFRPHAEGVDLPPHHEQCLGCGPDNPHGHHLQVRRYGDGVVAEHTFDNRHVGAPGIAHGGAVATVIDDLYGFLLYLGTPYRMEAGVTNQEGRKLFLAASLTDRDGFLVATSTAVFVTVGVDHFTRGTQ
jgi:acyl-coenzyme A thioesterase PaaI-like protein